MPADRKWLRNIAVAETLIATLKPQREHWLAQLEELGVSAKAELAAMRATPAVAAPPAKKSKG